MIRTYRSKKDSASALDHRDVIQNLDEKTSVFNAFYIQKIKQAKRELSCVGSTNHNNSANKVRKRKFVKRIKREKEPLRDSQQDCNSQSAFLTPDKSIRVNKAQDLFDQLLNSSTKQSVFPVTRPRNPYTSKRNIPTIKKLNNWSSSDSYGSDKENSNENSHDDTDIRTHELLIEKQISSPKHLDESIKNIVNKISILKKYRLSRTSCDDSVRNNLNLHQEHRLTANLASPDLSKSPLCSTPYKEKYRSQSIYNFSPISRDKKENSPNYVTIIEESVIDDCVVTEKQKESLAAEKHHLSSPIIQLSINRSEKSNKSTSKFEINSDLKIDSMSKDLIDSKLKKYDISVETCDFTGTEPFLGFSNPKCNDYSVVDLVYQSSGECHKAEEIIDSSFIFKSGSTQNKSDTIFHKNNNSNSKINDMPLQSDESDDLSYGTCASDESLPDFINNGLKVPIVNVKRLDDSIFMKYYTKLLNDHERYSTGTESDNYASLEDIEDISCDENLNDYINKADDNENIFGANIDDDDVTFLQNFSNENNVSKNNITQNPNEPLTNDSMENLSDAVDHSTQDDEERCISFVTTRRRNEVTNDSIILGLNNSMNSTYDAECNKTVLSNNDLRLRENLSFNLDVNDEYVRNIANSTEFQNEIVNSVKLIDKSNENTKLDTPTSANIHRDSCLQSSMTSSLDNTKAEAKPAIVLKPGKKWERSLSIYRRMTMMTDDFNHSVLENDLLQNKGRKYRQSVINTMEMQDFKGSLHNESSISRRSTFVSKPSRSTIRIIREPSSSRLSLCASTVYQDLKGFLSEDCDDTVVELSKLSIADSEHEVTVLENNLHDTSSRVSTARDYVLRRCNQTDAIHFDECYPEEVLKNCRKIGEGVYGEVFLWRARDGRARVMKIVPIAGTTKVNGEHQKDFHEIISEIVIAMELSALRTPIDELQRGFDKGKAIDALDLHSVENATDVFNEVLAVRCVYGNYPSRLLDLWELYDECNGSENDNPAILPADQQYIVLELANAGQDLESFEFNNAEQAHALFLQIAFGLAVAEEAFQFEHRDLHWGNVLIAPTDQKFAVFVLRGRAYHVASCGVAGTVIDYSLSRLSLPLGGASAHDAHGAHGAHAHAHESAALYNDLAADESLFDAVGDRQFDVYRLMRDKLGNDWKNFEPYTNILWLHYTVDKMITALRYKRTNTKIHKHYIAKLKGIKNRILEYGSVTQFVLTDNEF